MTNPDLAALSEAATKDNASGFITTEAIFRATLAQPYRSGDLVLIDREGMRERVAGAISTCPPMSRKHPEQSLPMADAAIAAILGEGKL